LKRIQIAGASALRNPSDPSLGDDHRSSHDVVSPIPVQSLTELLISDSALTDDLPERARQIGVPLYDALRN
jgi:hypothetical protein